MNIVEIDAAWQAVRQNPADTHAAAGLLEILGAASGDSRYRRAAGHLRGAHAGRKMRDDSAALADMAIMLEHGDVGSVRQAAKLATRAAPSERFWVAAAARLARKYNATR